MRLETAFGDFETDESDADLARAVADTVDAAQGIADAIKRPSADPDGECFECGETRPLRPLVAYNEDGEAFKAGLCAGCQETWVDRQFTEEGQAQLDAATVDDDPDLPPEPGDA